MALQAIKRNFLFAPRGNTCTYKCDISGNNICITCTLYIKYPNFMNYPQVQTYHIPQDTFKIINNTCLGAK